MLTEPDSIARGGDSTEERFKPTVAGWRISVVVAVAYGVAICLLVAYLPSEIFDSTTDVFILTIGLIGIWRYGWWFTHLIRGVIYRRITFPKLRRVADEITERGFRPSRIFVLCTSYRIEPEVTYAVYEGLIRNALEYGVPTTVFAAITDRTDVEVLNQVLDDYGTPDIIEIRYIYQRGDGKRSAMGDVLRAIARCNPGPDDLVAFMDGDIRLPATTFRRTMPFFLIEDDLGGLTTDNRAIVSGGAMTKEWYDLRYAQRHLLMSSTSLSRRVLVLTGRYSVIRADLCCRPDFIEIVERDQLTHKRFGTFRFLSGDDKSTWYWLLKHNWAMRYVPDAQVMGFEELPDSNRFISSTISLMRRWFGNMFRTSGRAIRLGPRGMGLFTWWSLVDQRLSIWTTLIGPTVAIALTVFVRPSFGLAYLLWIMGTRLLASILLGISRGRVSPLWPVLLYYNQIVGAALKSFVSFRFNQQTWTRQGISSVEAETPRKALAVRRESAALHVAASLALIMAVTFASGALSLPDSHTWKSYLANREFQSDDFWVASALGEKSASGPLLLPGQKVVVRWDTLADSKGVHLRGAGENATELRIIDPPSVSRSSDFTGHMESTGRFRCGRGPTACRLGDNVILSNLTLLTNSSAAENGED